LHQSSGGAAKKEIRYFWGYRNHSGADAQEELVLWKFTHSASINDHHQAIPLLQKTTKTFSRLIENVGGDALYDAENVLRFIIEELKGRAIVPRNPRSEQTISYTFKGQDVHCQADLAMHRKGKMPVKKAGITYLQCPCPIHFRKERRRYLLCPAAHPNLNPAIISKK
jgi:hypothetical protein